MDPIAQPAARLALALCAALVTLVNAPAWAEPLAVGNHNPLNAPLAPPPALGGALVSAGQWRVDLDVALANHFSDSGSSGGDRVRLDGETLTLRWRGRRAVGERGEIGVRIPWQQHTGGVLDGFLERYHDTFGLPDSGRDRSSNGNLLFELVDDGVSASRVDRRVRQLGDISVDGAWSLHAGADSQIALRGALSLPTGDADELTGSGGVGVSVALEMTRPGLPGMPRVTLHTRAGLAAHAGTDLAASDRPTDMFGTLALGWRALPRLQLLAQFDAHSARYDNQLRETGDRAAIGTLGGHLRVWKRLYWSLAIVEDLRTDVAPDVVLQTSLGWRSGNGGSL